MAVKERNVVKNVLLRCMGLKKYEKFVVVTDDILFDVAQIFYLKSIELGFDPVFVKYNPRNLHGEEPPAIISNILKNADVALLFTSKSISHTTARKSASKIGVRIASLPGITYEICMRTLGFDYNILKCKITPLLRRLNSANTIRVKTAAGTDITFLVSGRKAFQDTGIYTNKGAFGNLPAGEVCIAPVEGKADGVIVVDASIAGIGKLSKKVKINIKNGLFYKSNSKKVDEFIKNRGKNARNLAEFGIGLNPRALITGVVLEDEKALGTCHFAFGTNISFGGKIKAPIHIDAVCFSPEVYLDSKKIDIFKYGG